MNVLENHGEVTKIWKVHRGVVKTFLDIVYIQGGL